MNKSEAIKAIKNLRCLGCHRAPTGFEVLEMYASFGKKLVEGDGPNLRWRCKACGPS